MSQKILECSKKLQNAPECFRNSQLKLPATFVLFYHFPLYPKESVILSTKVSPCLKSKDYKTRCNVLDLTTLNQRRVRGDMIQKYNFFLT